MGYDSYSTLPFELALVDCTLPAEEEKESYTSQEEKESPARQEEKVSNTRRIEYQPSQPRETVTPPPASPEYEEPIAEPAPASTATPEPVTDATTPEPVSKAAASIQLEAGSEIERLRLNWKQVIEQAPPDTKRTPALAILRSAGVKPVSIENDIVSLSFRYPYHREQIEKVENQHVVNKIISSFLGRSCQIRCILEDNHLLKAALKMGAQIIDSEE